MNKIGLKHCTLNQYKTQTVLHNYQYEYNPLFSGKTETLSVRINWPFISYILLYRMVSLPKQRIIINLNSDQRKLMSLRKNQLKKMTIDQIMVQLSTEIDPDNIKLIHTFINQKNQNLSDKINALNSDIEDTRKKIEKSVKNLNNNMKDRVKDRIQKKETIVMDKDSRPSASNITDLMALFTYFQNQGKVVIRNNQSIQQLCDQVSSLEEILTKKADERAEFTQLDRRYKQLNEICAKQEAIRDQLLRQRDQKRRHYSNIEKSIDSYRRQYEIVQAQICEKQRQLIQLIGYYEARMEQDLNQLTEIPRLSHEYEQEILQAQDKLNQIKDLYIDRNMLRVQYDNRK